MGYVQIRAAQGKKDIDKFVQFPFYIYRNNPYWVPPLIGERKSFLDPAKNPFFQHSEVQLFLAERDGEVVGTIAGIINHKHNEVHADKVGFWGMFEVIEDYSVAEQLFIAARDWVKAQGMDTIRGPMNMSVNDECGLLLDAFDSSPVVMMTYNLPYYVDFVERFGFQKAMDLYAYQIDLRPYLAHESLPEKLVRVSELTRKRSGVTVRRANFGDFDNELRTAAEIYNQAWSKNWGAVPMTEAEFDHLGHTLRPLLDPALIYVIEKDGKAVGLSLSLPDLNQPLLHVRGRLFPFGWLKLWYYSKKIKTVRVFIMGVLEEYRSQGLDSIMHMETVEAALSKGMEQMEMSWILETNTMTRRIIERVGGRIYKTYRIYDLPL